MNSGATRFLGILLFVAMGASALVLGVISYKQKIEAPLKIDSSPVSALSQQTNSGESSKTKDTDNDGLSDYDELNIHQTSAYIKDSDSDGISDGEEVKAGTDPNCPKGQVCDLTMPFPEPNVTTDTGINTNTGVGATEPSIDTTGNLPVGTLANVAQIRALLKSQGVEDDILNSIDDQTLVNMYNEALPSATAN